MSLSDTSSKASSSPISIGWPGTSPTSSSSPSSSISSTSSTFSSAWTIGSSSYTNSLSCAFPSWPSRSSLSPELQPKDTFSSNNYNNMPSAYISDFDLFPEDLEDDSQVPFLSEAPAPPRERELPVPVAMPLLPIFAPERPQKKRRRSSKKVRVIVKPMSPIAECP